MPVTAWSPLSNMEFNSRSDNVLLKEMNLRVKVLALSSQPSHCSQPSCPHQVQIHAKPTLVHKQLQCIEVPQQEDKLARVVTRKQYIQSQFSIPAACCCFTHLPHAGIWLLCQLLPKNRASGLALPELLQQNRLVKKWLLLLGMVTLQAPVLRN